MSLLPCLLICLLLWTQPTIVDCACCHFYIVAWVNPLRCIPPVQFYFYIVSFSVWILLFPVDPFLIKRSTEISLIFIDNIISNDRAFHDDDMLHCAVLGRNSFSFFKLSLLTPAFLCRLCLKLTLLLLFQIPHCYYTNLRVEP